MRGWYATAQLVLLIQVAGADSILQRLEDEIQAVVEQARRSVVAVVAPHEEGGVRAVMAATGLVLDDSSVVTASSVVARSAQVEVVGPDGFLQPATVAGIDNLGGVALLKARALPSGRPVERTPRLGDLVILVTGQFEERAGCSLGMVTAVRPAGMNGQVTTEIEASTPALPGSAGGALVGSDGRIVGVVVGRVTTKDEAGVAVSGVVAVPLDEVKQVAARLKADGVVERSWLGVSVQEMTPALREILGLEEGVGIIVVAVESDGPAQRAGVELGDVILACDGKAIAHPGQLMAMVSEARPGVRVVLTVFRNGETLQTPVVLGALSQRASLTRR